MTNFLIGNYSSQKPQNTIHWKTRWPDRDIKNTNVLGHILMHTEEFNSQPEAYDSFFQAVLPFCGHITYLGTNVNIDHYMSGAIALGLPTVSKPLPPYIYLTYADVLHNSKSICKLLTMVDTQVRSASIPTGPRSTCGKHCHKCHQLRHIRHKCPKRQGKKVFFCK